MSELWICREKTARHPFCVETLGLKLYNLEELCYFLYENAAFLEEGLIGEHLFTWLREELELPRLSQHLKEYARQGKNPVWCAWFLLQEAGMYREQELLPIQQLAREFQNWDEFGRRKLAADQLLKNEKYNRCILEYEKLLSREDASFQKPELLGDIRHNLGVAYAGLFLFQEAALQFARAYEQNRREQSWQARQEALALAEPIEPPEEFVEPGDWGELLLTLREEYKKKVM